MSEFEAKPETRRSPTLIAIAMAGLLAVAAGIYLIGSGERKPEAPAAAPAGKVTRELAKGSLTAFVVKARRLPVADVKFTDAEGRAKSLREWHGRVVLVNLWATWCAPCRTEMPSLAALEQQLGSKDFEVVAVSLDRKGAEAAGAFLKDTGATNLALYLDSSAASLDQLQAIGLPASVLVDREGNEIGRMLGPADWSSPEALALIRAAIAETGQAS